MLFEKSSQRGRARFAAFAFAFVFAFALPPLSLSKASFEHSLPASFLASA